MIEVYKVDVFTNEPLKGNPAMVVLGTFDDKTMQKLAFELNVSETVFVDSKDFRLRFFTPTKEVDLCGHATIGAFHVLKLKGLEKGIYTAKTNAGRVKVRLDDRVWLNVKPRLVSDGETAIVDVGIKIGLKEVESFDELISLKPNDFVDLCRNLDVVGIYIYSFDSKFDACGRFFAPLYGISEDPVTGTANSALAYYLHTTEKLVKSRYTFEQGHTLEREGIVHVEVDKGVWVGGDAVLVFKGSLTLRICPHNW
ncbi:PhzF family phenazine biosynthesis protein [Archaeoglobus sp.]